MLGGAGEGSRGLSPWGSTFPICPQAQEIPGVKIFRSSSTLYFANVEMYAEALKKKVGAPPAPRCPPPVGTRGVTGSTGLCCLVERHQRGPPDREEEEGPQEAEEAAEESGEADGREEKGASLPREPPVVPPCPPALPSPAPGACACARLRGCRVVPGERGSGAEVGQSQATVSHPGLAARRALMIRGWSQ